MNTRASQRVAIIDLGSNTARLVVMSAVPGYSYRLEDEIREVVRLRQGMTRELERRRQWRTIRDLAKIDTAVQQSSPQHIAWI